MKGSAKVQKCRSEEGSGQRSAVGKNKNHMFGLLLLSWSLFLFGGCTNEDKMFKESRMLMDTYCTITVVSPSKVKARESIDAGFAEIRKLEKLLNYFSEDSEITAINKAAGIRPVRVSADTLEVLKKTYAVSEVTGGAFDATIAPVIQLWKFSKDSSGRMVPSANVVKQRLGLVDFRNIIIDDETSKVFLKKEGMEIDLGGIAKGYGADKALDALKSKGIRSALVAIAGDIRGYGKNLSGKGWKVGIQNPRPERESEKPWEDIFAVLHLEDRAISTSGDYQRFFMKDGKRYHHILNPATGYSADSGLISVTVIATEGYLSDSLSTAVFILGEGKGIRLLQSMGLDGVLVNSDKEIVVTENLSAQINILNPAFTMAD